MRSCAVFVSQARFLPPFFFFPLVAALIRSRALHTKRCIRRPRLVMSQPRPHCPFLSNCGFSTSSLPPYRGASVIGALSLLCQRAAGPGQGPLCAGFCPGCRPPVCPSLRATERPHPAPAPPGRAGQRDAEVRQRARLQQSVTSPLLFLRCRNCR